MASGIPQSSDDRLQRLRRCAFAFGVAVPLTSAFLLLYGFRLAPMHVGLLIILYMAPLVTANVQTVTLLFRRKPRPTMWVMGSVRAVVAVLTAVLAAFATTFWVFNEEIEAVRTAASPASWEARVHDLENELRGGTAILQRKLPIADQDSEIAHLQQQLEEKQAAVDRARREELCEFDGTCGTLVVGNGPQYRERVGYRTDLEREAAGLGSQLAALKISVWAQRTEFAQEQERASGRVDNIRRQLSQLGPRPTELRRSGALFTATAPHPVRGFSTWLGAFLGFLAIDSLALLLMTLRARRGDPSAPSDPQFRDVYEQQRKEDEHRHVMASQGAGPPPAELLSGVPAGREGGD